MVSVISYSQTLKAQSFWKNNGFWAVVGILQNFLSNKNFQPKIQKPIIFTNI